MIHPSNSHCGFPGDWGSWIDRNLIDYLNKAVLFAPCHKSNSSLAEHFKAVKIEVASIKDVQCLRFRDNQAIHLGIIISSGRSQNQLFRVSLSILENQTCVQLHTSFGTAEAGPG